MAVTSTQIQQLYVAYFARPADPVGLNFYIESAAASTAAGTSDATILDSISTTFAASAEYTANFTGMSNAQIVNQVYQNLFSHSADTSGLLYWAGKLTSGALTVSNIVRAISASAVGANNVDGVAFGSKVTAAESFTASLTTAEQIIGYSGTAAGVLAKAYITSVNSAATLATAIVPATLTSTVTSVVAAGNYVAGSTFTLTTGVNTFTGGAGADSYDGSLSSGAQTWQASDALVGGAGTDTITATLISSVTPVTMTGIEIVNVTVTTGSTLNLTNATGVTNVNSVNSTAQTTFSGITTAVTPSISDSASDHVLTYTGVTGSSDAETVNITGATGGLSVAGIELLTLNTATSASTLTNITGSTATTLTATGDQALTITAALPTTVTNVTAAAKTAGALTVTLGVVDAATLVGGAGADSFTISSATGLVNASGGAGNDTIVAATNLTITDTITGGDGTDTLSAPFASVSTAGYTTPTTRTITGIETLVVTTDVAGALTAVGVDTGITTVTMANATNTAAAVTFNAGSSTLNIGLSSAVTGTAATTAAVIATSLAVVGATTDADNITVRNNNSTAGTANAFAGIAITATATETLTINTGSYTTAVAQTSGTVSVTGSTGFQSAETLVITGANVYTPGVVTADIINASAMTATTGTIYDGTAGTTAQTLTGSAGNDVLVASTTSNVSISGGTGNDTITGGAGNDTLLGGDGIDVIVSGAGNDSVDAGAGNDSMTTTLNAADTLVGGDGTDTLTLDIIATAANAVGVSGWETIAVIAGTQTMAAFPSTNAITRVNVPTGTTSITNAGAAVVTLGSAAATTQVDFALATGSGTSDALTFRPGNTLTQTAVNLNDIETLTITNDASTTGAGVATITTLSATSLKTLNIAGLAGTVITNAITGTALTAVNDTHTGAGAVTLNISNATAAVTYTGGTATGATTLTMGAGNNIVTAGTATTIGNFTVTGGSGNDSMTGGFGADSFSGGAGTDTLIGGEGADTLHGGAGNDSLSGGAGVDQFESDSGADTIDGGAGTDVLTITGSFPNISADTITLVETLDMSSLATTMTIAQANLFTTFNNQAAITFSDAGTVAANATVLSYTLANGTNTITANATALNNTFTGGSGADTFNFGQTSAGAQLFDTNERVTGGTGTDTLNITGNVALTVTLGATTVLGVENIVVANTSTAVSITVDAATSVNESITIDGSSGTTTAATMTFNASAADGTDAYNLIGGSASDTLSGGAGADTITGSAGADSITGDAGVDNLSGGEGNDVFAVGTAAHLASGEVIAGGNGTDTLLLTVDAVNLTNIAAANDNLVTESSIEQLVVLATTSAYTLDEAISGTALAISQTTNSTNVQTFTTTMVGTSADYSLITRAATTYGPAATATFALDATDIFAFTGSGAADTIKAVPGVINQITPGIGADLITMASGNDFLILDTVANNGIDTVTSFTPGAIAAGVDVINATAAAAFLNTTTEALVNITANTTAGAANDNILLLNYGVYFADAAAVVLATNGVNTFGSGISGGDAHVLIAYQTAAGSAVRIADATVANAGGISAATDLVILTGVTTITNLVAANFILD